MAAQEALVAPPPDAVGERQREAEIANVMDIADFYFDERNRALDHVVVAALEDRSAQKPVSAAKASLFESLLMMAIDAATGKVISTLKDALGKEFELALKAGGVAADAFKAALKGGGGGHAPGSILALFDAQKASLNALKLDFRLRTRLTVAGISGAGAASKIARAGQSLRTLAAGAYSDELSLTIANWARMKAGEDDNAGKGTAGALSLLALGQSGAAPVVRGTQINDMAPVLWSDFKRVNGAMTLAQLRQAGWTIDIDQFFASRAGPSGRLLLAVRPGQWRLVPAQVSPDQATYLQEHSGLTLGADADAGLFAARIFERDYGPMKLADLPA